MVTSGAIDGGIDRVRRQRRVPDLGLELAELDWDKTWPLAVIALGIGTLWGAWSRMGTHGQGPTGA
jgi:hypothetical protein